MSEYSRAFIQPLHETVTRIISFVPRFLVAALLFLIFYAVAVFVRQTLRKGLGHLNHLAASARILVSRLIYLTILLVGLMIALSAANVNMTTVATSLGVAGFAFGFAFKDILGNFIAGILLLFARPFEIGDQVTLGKFEGTITDIEIRSTTLRTYADEQVTIPNSQIYSDPVVNHTTLGRRRYMVAFNTSLKADPGQVEREALECVTANPEVLQDPPPFLRLAAVDHGTDVSTWNLYYWAAPTRSAEVKTLSDILAQINTRLYPAAVPTPTSDSSTMVPSSQPEPNSSPQVPCRAERSEESAIVVGEVRACPEAPGG